MIIFLFYAILGIAQKKIDFHEFNVGSYTSFRDNIEKNRFLITLCIKNSEKYQFYKNFFIDISKDISRYIKSNINVSYVFLLDPNLNNKFEATFYIYLPGISEMEVPIYPRLSVAFNTNKIVKGCLQQAIDLRRLEKEQKSPEIARIKEELRQIAKMLKKKSLDHSKQEKLMEDYKTLTEELMQYIPENKQKERRLRLQLQITSAKSSKYKKIEKEISKEKQIRENFKQNSPHELSPHKLDKLNEKQIIQFLRDAVDKSSLNVISSAFVGMYNWVKDGIVSIMNKTSEKHGEDL